MKTIDLIIRLVLTLVYVVYLWEAISFQRASNYPAATYHLLFGIFLYWVATTHEK